MLEMAGFCLHRTENQKINFCHVYWCSEEMSREMEEGDGKQDINIYGSQRKNAKCDCRTPTSPTAGLARFSESVFS